MKEVLLSLKKEHSCFLQGLHANKISPENLEKITGGVGSENSIDKISSDWKDV